MVGNSNTITKTVTGDTNQITFTCGNNTTGCTSVTSTMTLTGDLNTVTSTIRGSTITNTLAITGDSNTVTQTITTDNSTSNITILGDSNTFTSSMTGASAGGGHHLVAAVTGTSNTHTVTQYGSVDTTVNLTTTGNSNTVVISTGRN